MEKIDLRKQYKSYYTPSSKEFSFVHLPPLPYIMVDGHGSPASPMYSEAVQTLYSLAYTLKFALKKTTGPDFTVMGLEGLWWMPDMTQFSTERKDEWDWTSLMLQPDFITQQMFKEAVSECKAKGKAPMADQARLELFDEGECVQILFFGLYKDEGPTIARMHAFIHDQGFELTGKHHEIYLTDPRRVAPEKNKTILRQPVRKR